MKSSLQNLLKKIGAKIDEEKSSVLKDFKEIVDRVYRNAIDNPEYADRFSSLVETLRTSAESGRLERRIDGVISYLRRGIDEAVQETSEDKITTGEAVALMIRIDKKTKAEVLSGSGYMQRIYTAVKRGEISLERVSPRKAYVSRDQIIKLANAGLQEAQAKTQDEKTIKIGSTKITGTTSEVYNSLRRSGMSTQEIRERYPHFCPQGKDFGKFFGGLEGAFQKYKGK